jgi:dolichol kinase
VSGDKHYAQIRKEIFRKSIHILGFLVPFISLALGITVAAVFVVGMAAVYSLSEYMRLKGRSVPVFTVITKIAMRNDGNINDNEKQNTFVKAPLYFAAGVLLSLLIFPAPFNYVAIAVVTLGDGFASVVGRMYGKNKIPYSGGKSIEGTAAGFVCAFAGSLFFASPAMSLVAASVGMIIEFLPLRVSDNLTVPLLSGLSMTIIGNF